MRDDTRSKLLFWAVIAIIVLLAVLLCIAICQDLKAESIETPINSYPFWAVSASGDSTFQTVQVLKCWETFPNGQVELLGYKVAVDSSGCRIYEGKPDWFLNWATWEALSLQVGLGKQKGD